jgi:hypothetical protein
MILLALLTARRPAAQGPLRIVLLDTAALVAARLDESSGIAASTRRPGLFWTHNDSGDEPVLYATDSTGRDLGLVRVAGARAVDWEDMSAGPCVVAPGPCLYVGDIGDNQARRPYVVVYRLAEPDAPLGAHDTLGATPVMDSIVLRYPDRPHDAEALAVTPSGDILIVTKDRIGPAVLFRASARATSEAQLERVGVLEMTTNPFLGRLVTGAAISPDGSVLVVRTYVSLHLFRLNEGLPSPLTASEGLPIPVVEPQGEAVTFDGPARLVLTSERADAAHGLMTRLLIQGLPR